MLEVYRLPDESKARHSNEQYSQKIAHVTKLEKNAYKTVREMTSEIKQVMLLFHTLETIGEKKNGMSLIRLFMFQYFLSESTRQYYEHPHMMIT